MAPRVRAFLLSGVHVGFRRGVSVLAVGQPGTLKTGSRSVSTQATREGGRAIVGAERGAVCRPFAPERRKHSSEDGKRCDMQRFREVPEEGLEPPTRGL
jgi:hypothetical protein